MNGTEMAGELVRIAKELVAVEFDLKSEVEQALREKFPQFVFRTRRSPRGIIKIEAEPPSAGLPRFVEWVDPQMFGETEWNPNASRERQFERLLRQVEFYLTKVWKKPQ
jgi:hypothetical protein